MADTILEADKVLQELTQELQHFRSASEQLSLADQNITELLPSIEQLIGKTGELATQGQLQVDAMRELREATEARLAVLVEQHHEAIATMHDDFQLLQTALKSDVLPVLSQQSKALAELEQLVDKAQNDVAAHMAESTAEIRQVLQSEVTPAIDEVKRLGRLNRTFAIIIMVLVVLSLAPWVYIFYLASLQASAG